MTLDFQNKELLSFYTDMYYRLVELKLPERNSMCSLHAEFALEQLMKEAKMNNLEVDLTELSKLIKQQPVLTNC